MSLKKEDYASFEIQDMDSQRLFYTEKHFDFPKMYDMNDRPVENMLVIKGKNLPEISSSQYVYVIARKKTGDRIRYKASVSVSSVFQMNVLLRIDTAEDMEERRRFFKIKTNERAYITFITRMIDGNESVLQLDAPIEIAIKDINVGGIFFVCEYASEFIKGDKIMVIINLNDTKLELMTEILRLQPVDEPPNVGCGCRFLDVTHTQEEVISRYIYKRQYEMIKKEREKQD